LQRGRGPGFRGQRDGDAAQREHRIIEIVFPGPLNIEHDLRPP